MKALPAPLKPYDRVRDAVNPTGAVVGQKRAVVSDGLRVIQSP